VAALLLVLLVAIVNFLLGFALASQLGHGPAWARLPNPNYLNELLRSVLRTRS
jgi:hypothetical protein